MGYLRRLARPESGYSVGELSDSAGGQFMNRLLLKLAMATIGSLLYSIPAATQVSPTTTKTARVRITQGPEIERADPDFAIIRWTSNNPGGSPEHYGIVRYGTDPKKLNQTAKSPIRLNPGHSYTVFRVRMEGLKPRTTYYYTVESEEANGRVDGVKSTIKHLTTR
jgi:phosphodiesterase/alkaline phosphatase D-like protein